MADEDEDREPDPDDEDEDNGDDLPVTLPKGAVRSRFSVAAIDYSVNKKLQGLVPAEAGAVVVDVMLKSGDKSKVLTGIAAVKVDDRWGLVLAGSLDLVNRHDYVIEILAVRT